MPYIMNSLEESVSTQAHGKWFTWKPREIKLFHNEKLVGFLAMQRGEEGLVEVPDSMMEMDKTSQEYKEALYAKIKEGVTKYIAKQNYVIRNLEMSLRRDYETSGQKGNFLFEASKGELQAYKNLKKYKEFEQQEHLNVADEIQKVRDELYGNTAEPEKKTSGRPSPLEPAKKGQKEHILAQVITPTLEKLVKEARILLNQPQAENSRFSDAELTGYANDAVQQVFLAVNEASEGQFDKTANLSIVSGVETVALPTDCFAVKALYKIQGTVNRRLEYKNSILQDYDNNATNSGSTTYEPYYYFRGNNLVLRPIPGFSETTSMVVEYTAYPTVLVYGGDTMDTGISPLFKELIVMYIVSKAKLKDDLSGGGNTRGPAQAYFADLYNNFKHQLMERSKGPQYVTPYEPV